MAVAPDSVRHLANDVVDKYRGPGTQDEQLAGIVHGPFDTPGFHWSRNELAAAGALGNYSMADARNRTGGIAHPDYASALDFHFGPAGMIEVTKRLIVSAKDPNDHRLDGVYEFCGTTNGSTPHPYTVATNTDDPSNTQGWDYSHVTHVHFSFWRDKVASYDAIKGVADVIAGIPLEDDMTPEQDKRQKHIEAMLEKVLTTIGHADDFPSLIVHGDDKHPNSLDAINVGVQKIVKKVQA